MDFQNDIYVSYAAADYERIDPLLFNLRNDLTKRAGANFRIWIDRRDILPGTSWREEQDDALARSRSMLMFLSRPYLQSEVAAWEWKYFLLVERPMFPIVIEEIDSSEVPPPIAKMRWFKPSTFPLASGGSGYREFIDKLSKRIVHVLDHPVVLTSDVSDVQASAAVPSEQKPAKGYVFLSYAEEDSDFLEQLRSFFGDHGYAYWEFEKSDRDYQKRIDLELESVITNAVATVSILSESWRTSDWSVRELYFSQEIGKPVFLLKAKPFRPILAISGFPYIDFTKNTDEAFSRLERELKRKGL